MESTLHGQAVFVPTCSLTAQKRAQSTRQSSIRQQQPANRQRSRRSCLHCRASRQTSAAGLEASARVLAAGLGVAAVNALAWTPSAAAADLIAQVADAGSLPLALGGGAAVAALSIALITTDPDKRRQKQTKSAGGNEMDAVRDYFNTEGFGRWKKIYGDKDDVSKVQRDIREGHAETVAKVLRMIDAEGGVKGRTCCDVGCGTGSLSIPLAQRGAVLTANDISDAMVNETKKRWQQLAVTGSTQPSGTSQPTFEAKDLESVTGKFDTVCCLDVLIHYPQEKADGMIKHLAGLADKKLILSFAPKTLQYSLLKRVGELFPGPSKATRAYLHAEADVEAALQKAGFQVVKKEMTATSFYFSRLFEAKRA